MIIALQLQGPQPAKKQGPLGPSIGWLTVRFPPHRGQSIRAAAPAIAFWIIWISLRENLCGSFCDSVIIHPSGPRTCFIAVPSGKNADAKLIKRVSTSALQMASCSRVRVPCGVRLIERPAGLPTSVTTYECDFRSPRSESAASHRSGSRSIPRRTSGCPKSYMLAGWLQCRCTIPWLL